MSFQTGLSGLNASSRSLDVIGNNIANANTTGMKMSRTEFGDLVASSLGAAGSGGGGIGVSVLDVAQQFSQGNISSTGNSMDVAINGNGFFQLELADGSKAYTRDGSFKLDKDGYLKTNTGGFVMGYPTDKTGAPTSSTITKLQLPTSQPIPASATQEITAEFNLDARALNATEATAAGEVPSPRSTYGTSLNVYDAQGVASPVNLYFVKRDQQDLDGSGTINANNDINGDGLIANVDTDGNGTIDAAEVETETFQNTWDIYSSLTGTNPVGTMVFDTAGRIASLTQYSATGTITSTSSTDYSVKLLAGTIASTNPNEATGFLPDDITVTLTDVTQFGTAYAVSNLTQDGYTAGELTGMNIGENGLITTRYSNGQTQYKGMLTLADFRNVQGLAPIGGNNWVETYDSGLPVQGSPGVGKFGALSSGALEDSNVDLTSELVNMMTAQRAYQANAQTIKTQDQIMSTLVNLR